MTGELVHPLEANATVDHQAIAALADRVIATVLDPDDPDRYRDALDRFVASTPATLWLVELLVEAELAANGKPVREPCGIRRTAWTVGP